MWKRIKNTEYYECNELGEFRSLDHYTKTKSGYNKLYKGRTLKVSPDASGYGIINLKKGERRSSYSAHRTVYETFIGDIPNNMTVDHINEITMDNRLENLQLLTAGDNSAKSIKRGTPMRNVNLNHGDEIREKFNGGMKIREIAAEYNISGSYAEKICSGKYGVKKVKKTRSYKRMNQEKMLKMERDGYSYASIGLELDLTEAYVKQQCFTLRQECPRYKISLPIANIIIASKKTNLALAKEYGVSPSYISAIRNGKRKNKPLRDVK